MFSGDTILVITVFHSLSLAHTRTTAWAIVTRPLAQLIARRVRVDFTEFYVWCSLYSGIKHVWCEKSMIHCSWVNVRKFSFATKAVSMLITCSMCQLHVGSWETTGVPGKPPTNFYRAFTYWVQMRRLRVLTFKANALTPLSPKSHIKWLCYEIPLLQVKLP